MCSLDQSRHKTYFHQGYEYEVIRDFLEIHHEIVMSLSTLKRRLKEYGLSRVGNNNIDDNTLRNVIQHEMSGPGDLRGYRAIWHSLRLTHHIHVSRRRIADLLRELNPIASEQRRIYIKHLHWISVFRGTPSKPSYCFF